LIEAVRVISERDYKIEVTVTLYISIIGRLSIGGHRAGSTGQTLEYRSKPLESF